MLLVAAHPMPYYTGPAGAVNGPVLGQCTFLQQHQARWPVVVTLSCSNKEPHASTPQLLPKGACGRIESAQDAKASKHFMGAW